MKKHCYEHLSCSFTNLCKVLRPWVLFRETPFHHLVLIYQRIILENVYSVTSLVISCPSAGPSVSAVWTSTMGKAFAKLFGKKDMRILMLGLDAAGKTSILLQHAVYSVPLCLRVCSDCVATKVAQFVSSKPHLVTYSRTTCVCCSPGYQESITTGG